MMDNRDDGYKKNTSHSSEENINRQEIFDSRDIKAPTSLLPRLMQRLHVAQQNEQFFTTIASLQVALDNADEFVRAAAIRGLAQWQGDTSSLPVDRLLTALSDSSWMVREAAIFTLDALHIEVSQEYQMMALLDENEFVREAARLIFTPTGSKYVQARTTTRVDSTIQQVIEMGKRMYHVLHSIDSFFLAIHFTNKRGVFMAGQYPQDDTNNLTYLEQITLQQRKRRRKTLGITGAVLAVLVIAGLAFSWFTVLQKMPHNATGHTGNTLDKPIISDTNPSFNDPKLHWLDNNHFALSEPYNNDAYANIWNVQTKTAQQEEIFGTLSSGQLSSNPYTLWSPNGQFVVNENVVSDTPSTLTASPTSYTVTVEVWNVLTNQKIVTVSYHEEVASIKGPPDPTNTPSPPSAPVSPDNTRLAIGQHDGNVTIWSLSTGKQITSYHIDSSISFVQWSADSQRLLTQSSNGLTQVWDMTTWKLLSSFLPPLTQQIIYTSSYPQSIKAIKNVPTTPILSPDGKRMVGVVGKDTVEVWDANTTKLLYIKQTSKSLASTGWLSNKGIFINTIGNIQVWNLDTNQIILNVPVASQAGFAFSPSQRYFSVINPSSRNVPIWDTPTGQRVTILRSGTDFQISGDGQGFVWSPDERYVATLSQDQIHKALNNVIQIWNATTGKLVMQYHSHSNQVQQVTWSPDGKYLASVSNGDLGDVMEVWQAPR